jgi:hypothetical protein
MAWQFSGRSGLMNTAKPVVRIHGTDRSNDAYEIHWCQFEMAFNY